MEGDFIIGRRGMPLDYEWNTIPIKRRFVPENNWERVLNVPRRQPNAPVAYPHEVDPRQFNIGTWAGTIGGGGG